MWWMVIGGFAVAVAIMSVGAWLQDRERDQALQIQRDVENWRRLRSIR
jgi:hypothetical protein